MPEIIEWVEVSYKPSTPDAWLPVTRATRVFDPEDDDREPGIYSQEGGQIEAGAAKICEGIWESMAWLVPKWQWPDMDATHGEHSTGRR